MRQSDPCFWNIDQYIRELCTFRKWRLPVVLRNETYHLSSEDWLSVLEEADLTRIEICYCNLLYSTNEINGLEVELCKNDSD